MVGQDDSAATLGAGGVNTASAAKKMNASVDRAIIISSLPSLNQSANRTHVSLDSIAAINSIDKTTRVESSHQTIVDKALDIDVPKARFS
jgi:hypothetical protein